MITPEFKFKPNFAAAALLALLMVCASALAQHDNRNAAMWFQRAIDQYMRLLPEGNEALGNYLENPQGPPPAEVRHILNQAQPIFSIVRRGAAQEYSDYQLDHSQGFELLLPHLIPMRGIARLMTADALMRMQEGDSMTAAARVADMYRMSGHLGDDRVLISSLVGQSMFNLAERAVQNGLDRGAFSPEQTSAMISSLKWLGTDDPFNYVECVAAEQQLTVASLEKFIDEPDGIQKIASLFGEEGNTNLELLALDRAGYDAAIDQYDQMMDRAVEIFSIDDPEKAKAAMAELERDLIQGRYGSIAKYVTPAFGKVLENKFKASAMITERLAVLEQLAAAGQAAIQETANAAVWYLRGIELLEQWEPPILASIREWAAHPEGAISDEIVAKLQAAPEVIESFRTGSSIKRCDFKSARPADRLLLLPRYAPGMHDALRLIQCQAMRQLRGGDQTDAAQWLAVCLRITGHLGGDPVFASALIAQTQFDRTMALIESGMAKGSFTDLEQQILADGLDRISRRDPFGYVGAIIESRRILAKRFTERSPRDETERQRCLTQTQIINTWNADQLMYVAVILAPPSPLSQAPPAEQTTATAPATGAGDHSMVAAGASTHSPDPLERLSDVLSLAQIDAVRSEAPHVIPRLQRDEWDIFGDRAAVPWVALPGGIMNRMHSARGDLRKALLLLEPPARKGAEPAASMPASDEKQD